jgi:hypothetical protein
LALSIWIIYIQYFIKKFEAIPEEKWCVDKLDDEEGRKCANGHCGVTDIRLSCLTEESIALWVVFQHTQIHDVNGTLLQEGSSSRTHHYSEIAARINNGQAIEYQQETPKQRILAALRDIQSRESQDQAVEQVNQIIGTPLCPECGRPGTLCTCLPETDDSEEEEEDWGAGEVAGVEVGDNIRSLESV